MPLSDLPFSTITDPAGHCITGITFDRPIPWKTWEGYDVSNSSVADAIGEAVDSCTTKGEPARERLEKLCDDVEREDFADALAQLKKVEEYADLIAKHIDHVDGPAARKVRVELEAMKQVLTYAKQDIEGSVEGLKDSCNYARAED